MCTIPANIEKTFDQISNAAGHVFRCGAFPVILGGDHSIGFATVRGIARETDKKIGIIHFDRHADIQETHSGVMQPPCGECRLYHCTICGE